MSHISHGRGRSGLQNISGLSSFARGFKFHCQSGPSVLGPSAVWGRVKAFVSSVI